MKAIKNEKKRGTGSCGRHVIARVQHDERADERHEQREQPRKPVHAQVEVEPVLRQPREGSAHDADRRQCRRTARRSSAVQVAATAPASHASALRALAGMKAAQMLPRNGRSTISARSTPHSRANLSRIGQATAWIDRAGFTTAAVLKGNRSELTRKIAAGGRERHRDQRERSWVDRCSRDLQRASSVRQSTVEPTAGRRKISRLLRPLRLSAERATPRRRR